MKLNLVIENPIERMNFGCKRFSYYFINIL